MDLKKAFDYLKNNNNNYNWNIWPSEVRVPGPWARGPFHRIFKKADKDLFIFFLQFEVSDTSPPHSELEHRSS